MLHQSVLLCLIQKVQRIFFSKCYSMQSGPLIFKENLSWPCFRTQWIFKTVNWKFKLFNRSKAQFYMRSVANGKMMHTGDTIWGFVVEGQCKSESPETALKFIQTTLFYNSPANRANAVSTKESPACCF